MERVRPAMKHTSGPVWLAALILALTVHQAPAQQVAPERFIQRFPVGTMGGIETVLRYRQARPDRTDTAILFLAHVDRDGIPEQVEVLGPTGDQVHPVDSQGADCVLERIALIRRNDGVILVDAVRVYDAANLQAGYSTAAAFNLQVYRLGVGDDTTDSSLVFRASGRPVRSPPLCSERSVQQAIARIIP